MKIISLRKRQWLRRIDALRKRAVQLDVGWEFRRWQDGTVFSAEDLAADCERLYGEQTYTAHRADLLAALRSQLPAGAVVLGHKCARVDTRGESLRRDFAHGAGAEADIVIGADGVHFVLRGTLFGPSPASFSGFCAFRALVPADAL
ncbi:hypothetical protein OIE69_03065 [Actinacidiphila glaucinigra]|uniref:hypothetical protein n=1 Tax=Actinacidiphila glaucinigra TaxID=235986 RepID=UPI002DD9CFF1|nr:hypothetical protein [Actinacidiphila glaucinigra]WSD57951.1 hypothetical protein OIE69_03065 [Actinacidiphila glaucinigra]